MKKIILSKTLIAAFISSSLLLVGCNDNDDKKSKDKGEQQQQQKEQITGTVATGAALAFADVEIVNKDGEITLTETDKDGKFTVEVAKGAPYMVKASQDDTVLYSYTPTAGYVNVTQLTTQAILSANAQSDDPEYHSLEDIFKNWKEFLADPEVDVDEINEALEKTTKQAIANLKSVFEANGFNASKGYPDIFKYKFDADSTGFDSVLDRVQINGLNSECKGTGTAYHCDVTYKVDGQDYSWSYDINTNGINVIINMESITDGNGSGLPTGNYNLKVTTSVMGQGSTVTINNIPKPANQNQFCASDDIKEQLSTIGSYKINKCSFSGNTGNINATITVSGMALTYDVKYEYSPS